MDRLKLHLDIKQIRKIVKKIEGREEEHNRDLESRAKQLHELVATETFTVEDVIATTHPTYFTPNSEIMIGGISPSYSGGFTSRLTLKVSPDNQDIPIRTLTFDGFSIIKAGDYISAQIPKYKEERKLEFLPNTYNKEGIFYVDRDFDTKETAIELALLSNEGETLRKDRAINYKTFTR